MTSSGSDIQVRLTLHDLHENGDVVAGSAYGVTPGPTWQFIQVKHIDLLPIHDGHTLQVRAVALGTTGSAWFDDVQLIEELPLPLSVFLLYPNFRGYLWSSGPQGIRFQVDVSAADLSPLKIHAVLVNDANGGTVSTIDQAAQASQTLTFDGSSLALGSYKLQVELDNTSTGQTVATYPAYEVVKVDSTFQSSLVNFIDTDNFLVRKGQKRFLWGVYDRFSTLRCTGCLYTTTSDYETKILGFNGLTTVNNYADCLSVAQMIIFPFSAVNPNSPDQLDPWLQVMDSLGIGHIQIVNNWVVGNPNIPYWATGMTNNDLWTLAASMEKGKPGALGYYTFDEPKTDLLSQVFDQYQVLQQGNPGGVAWGTLVNARSVFRWRDAADVMSSDPYPVGTVPDLDDVANGATLSPAMVRTSFWTHETVRQVASSRPVWMVLQLWIQGGQFPVYNQMKTQAYKAIINGANGIMWWGFVSVAGMEAEWYVLNNQQAYFDYRRISNEVMALEPDLILPNQQDTISSVSDPRIEFSVKVDPAQIVIIAANSTEVSVSNVTFTLSSTAPPVKAATPVQVYSEGRTLPVMNGNSFTDGFNPYEAHVYILTRQ